MCAYEPTVDATALQFARDNLNESTESRERNVHELKVWLESMKPELNARTDFRSILMFLRGCKFDVEKTKTKMKNYYSMRSDTPEWFSNRDPDLPRIQELINLGVFLPLKNRDREGRMVVIIKVAAHDPNKHSEDDVFKTDMMILDIALKEMEEASIYGVVAILDMAEVSFGHAMQMKPHIIKKAVGAWQNYSVRPKKLHFINAPRYVNVVLNVFRQFMSDKLKSRTHVYSNGIQELYGIVPQDILPTEYGGESGDSIEDLIQFWKSKLNENREWLIDDEKYKTIQNR